MLVTVFEGPKSSGKTSHLITCVLSRAMGKRDCWVFVRDEIQLDLILDLAKNMARDTPLKRYTKFPALLEFVNGSRIRFAVLDEKWDQNLVGAGTSSSCLFVNDGDYSLDLQDSLLKHPGGWHEVMVTRTTGPDAPDQRTVH